MPNFVENYWTENAPLWRNELVTRFPPEPSGYSHLGHALAACANFRLAEKFGGKCHLRMDDTNPGAESAEFVESIVESMRWLGFEWEGEVKHASDYFPYLFELAKALINEGSAYVDFSDRETTRLLRGSFNEPGRRSADADRPASWHMAMFEKMAAGEFPEGACALRARLDMGSPNMNLRDPVLYRVKSAEHHRAGSSWKIMPAYDFAHPASDFVEGVTLSLCSLEFEDHRPVYDWVTAKCAALAPGARALPPPMELEFARLELDRGLTSKRKIKALVESEEVDGWDDPRLLTLSGLRRRGFTPSALRTFCEEAGLSKANSTTPCSRLEDFLRLDLDPIAPRRFVVANPVELDVLDGPTEISWAEAANHPKDAAMGTRLAAVSSSWWIEADDIRLAGAAEKGFKRVEPGAVFRIMSGLVLECVSVVAREDGSIAKVLAKMSEAKPRCAIHGLARETAKPIEIWEPSVLGEDESPSSRLTIRSGYAEPASLETEGTWQASRYGYCRWDSAKPGRLIRATGLKGG